MDSWWDFIVIIKNEEMLGGLPITKSKVTDFNYCINICLLEDIGFKGGKYTWWNGRIDEECIFKGLDRVLCNAKMISSYPVMDIEHLIRSGSEHAPLLIYLRSSSEKVTKPLDSWIFGLKKEHSRR